MICIQVLTNMYVRLDAYTNVNILQNNFHGDDLSLYTQHLNTLQKLYAELLTTSNKRLSDLEILLDFIQSATNQLVWLNEREETEITRDWSDKEVNVPALEQYYDCLLYTSRCV